MLGVALFFLALVILDSYKNKINCMLCSILSTVIFFGLIISIFVPFDGFDKKELIETTELEPFYINESGQNIYAIKDNDQCTITYLNDENEVCTVSYYAEVIEDKNCEKAVKEVYKMVPKKSLWSLGLLAGYKKHIVIVPPGGVRK